VDLVIEAPDGTITGVEVKSSGGVSKADTAGLRMLRDVRAERFDAGIVLHTGTHAYTIEERIYAVPIDRRWSW
jgi:predicted AAA+ superfamily ATPase